MLVLFICIYIYVDYIHFQLFCKSFVDLNTLQMKILVYISLVIFQIYRTINDLALNQSLTASEQL